LLPSKRQTTFANRVHWAKSYLGKAGLIELTRRAHFRITDPGRDLLAHPPKRIDIAFLKRYPQFNALRFASSDPDTGLAATPPLTETPSDILTPG